MFAIGILRRNGFSIHHILSVFNRNDTGWYKNIYENGYQRITDIKQLGGYFEDGIVQSSWAFFPFYPYVLKSVSYITGIGFEGSAFIVSIAFTFTLLCGIYLLSKYFFKNEKIALWTALIYLVFPLNYHFQMYYTEAIFGTFLMFSFWGIQQKKYWLSSIALAALCLIRPNGVVCFLPIGVFLLEQLRLEKHLSIKNVLLKSWIFILPVVCFLSYLYYQYQMTGYFTAFSKAQAGWGKEFLIPFQSLFRTNDFASQFNSIYTIIVMGFALYIMKKIPLSWNILIWINILLPLTAGSAISMYRYISIIFPLFIMFGYYVYKLGNKKPIYIIASLGLQLWLFYYWIINTGDAYYPISY